MAKKKEPLKKRIGAKSYTTKQNWYKKHKERNNYYIYKSYMRKYTTIANEKDLKQLEGWIKQRRQQKGFPNN